METCSHVFRTGPLHPSIKIGGGVATGRCQNECYPRLNVCFEHATAEALALLGVEKSVVEKETTKTITLQLVVPEGTTEQELLELLMGALIDYPTRDPKMEKLVETLMANHDPWPARKA